MQTLDLRNVTTVAQPQHGSVTEPTNTHVADQLIVPITTARIGSNGFFVERLEETLARLAGDTKLQSEDALYKAERILSSPATNRPHVFVAKIIDDTAKKPILDYVNNVKAFRELLGSLEEPEVVSTYNGPDASEVTVVRARIPAGYVARVPYVRLRHVPQSYKHQGHVILKEIGSTKKEMGDRECLHVCREMFPLWTNRKNGEFSADEMNRVYHFITIKFYNSDNTIKRWNPGLDKHMAPFMSLQDMFVLVGKDHEFRHQNDAKAVTTAIPQTTEVIMAEAIKNDQPLTQLKSSYVPTAGEATQP